MRFYLAGPFFNPVQVGLINELENALDPHHQVFSPRRECFVAPDGSALERQRAFELNCQHVADADLVLAVLTYALPPRQSLRVVTMPEPAALLTRSFLSGAVQVPTFSPPLALPDTGTVWELGYAYARRQIAGKPHLLAFYSDYPAAVNLMLAEGFDDYLVGAAELDKWLRDGSPLTKSPWQGRIV